MSKEIQLSKEQAEEFYKEHKDEEYFEELTTNMSRSASFNAQNHLRAVPLKVGQGGGGGGGGGGGIEINKEIKKEIKKEI